MFESIKTIIDANKNNANLILELKNIKKYIDDIMDAQNNDLYENNLKNILELSLANNNITKKEYNELKKIKISKNFIKTHEDSADYFLDIEYAYDLKYKSHDYTFYFQWYGDKEEASPEFYCEDNKEKTLIKGKKITYDFQDLYERIGFKNLKYVNFISFLIDCCEDKITVELMRDKINDYIDDE